MHDATVSRDHRPRQHLHAVPATQFTEQDALAAALGIDTQTGCRQQVDQLRRRGGRAFAGAPFQVAPGQEEQGEHADSVEIQLAATGDSRPDPGTERQGDGQRDGQVHGQVAGAQVTRCAFEKGRAAVEDDGNGEEQGHPAQDCVQLGGQVHVEFRPGGHGCHHRLEPQQSCDPQPAQRTAVFPVQLLGRLVRLIGVGGVANPAQRRQHLRQRQLPIIPAQQQPMIGQVQARLGHPRQVAQVLVDQPAAGGATDALDQQRGFGQFALVPHESLLHIAAVVQRQLVLQLPGQGLRVGAVVAAVLVVVLEAPGHDRLGHSLAAWAAEGSGLPQDHGGEPATGGDGQCAVVAGGRLGHRIIALHKSTASVLKGVERLAAPRHPTPGSRHARPSLLRTGATPDRLRCPAARRSAGH